MAVPVTTTMQNQIANLYIAILGRNPEPAGFSYWVDAYANANATPSALQSITLAFGKSPEFISTYGGKPTQDAVAIMYQNVLNRAPDAGGLAYWTAQTNALIAGGRTIGEALALTANNIITVAAANTGTGDATLIAAKQAAAVQAGTTAPANTYPLTTSADNIQGQSGNDVITGALANNGASDTFQTWDTIDGGAGTNTLNVEVSAGTYNATLANIQNMNVQQASGAIAPATFGLNGLSSLQNLSLNGPQGFAVNNLGSVPNVSITGTTANTTLTFNASALAPAAQTLNLTLNGVNSTVTLLDVGTNALETLAITATGSASNTGAFTFGAAGNSLGTTNTTIAGSANLTMVVADASATMRTINGSAATGNLTLTGLANSTITTGSGNDVVNSAGGVDNFTGGAGNDRFVFGAGLLTNQDTVDGGDGTGDAIWTTTADANTYSAASVTPRTVTNVEVLSLTNATAPLAIVAANIASSLNTLELQAGTAAGASAVTMGAGTATVNIGRSTATSGPAQTLLGQLTVTDTGTATTDTLTIANTAFTAGGANLDVFNNQAIVVNGYETVNLNTGTATGGVVTNNTGVITLTGDAGADSTLNILGNQTLNAAGQITATNINASALVGSDSLDLNGANTLSGVRGLVMGAAAAEGLTSITGSAYADYLRGDTSSSIAGGAGNDSIVGGAGNDSLHGQEGNDTITGGTGNDLIEGGAGNDQIIFATGELTANDTVNGGEGTADVLRYTTFTAADNASDAQARVSNFEYLRMEGAAGPAVPVTLSNYANNTGFERIQLGTNDAGSGYNFQNASALLNNISTVAAVAGSHTFDRLVDTSADTLTVQNTRPRDGGLSTITALTALDEETITLTASVPTTAGNNGLTIGTLTVTDLTTLNITSASNVIITNAITAGTAAGFNLATVNASTATGAVTVNASNTGTAVTMTGNSSSAGVITFTGGAFADSITGGAAADVLVGNAGADTITAGAGTDNITGGVGADLVVLGGDGAVDTVVQNVADSLASTAASFAGATVAAGDSLTFGNGIDRVTGFVAGATGDAIQTIVAGGPTALIGANQNALANGVYIASGTYNATTGVFTISAADPNGSAGPDTMVLQATAGTAASTVASTNANVMILLGVNSTQLVAGNFVLGANAVALTGTYNAGVFTLTSSTTVNGTVSISQTGVVTSTDGAAVVTQPAGFVQANLTSFSLAGLTTTNGTISNFDGGISTGLNTVTGSAGNDVFVFASEVFGAAAATVNGSGGTDTLRFTTYGTDTVGDAGAGIVSIENIELAGGATQLTMDNTVTTAVAISNTSTANAAATVLLGTGAAHSFTALSTNTGTQTVTIGQNGQNVTTGAGTDDVIVATAGLALTGSITGNGGADTFTVTLGNGETVNLTGATLSGIETLRWGNDNTSTVSIDEANLASFTTAITGNAGGGAQVLNLVSTGNGVFDFSTTALTLVETVTIANGGTNVTFQALDVGSLATLTGSAVGLTTVNFTNTTNISADAVTAVDTVTIGGADQTLTLANNDMATAGLFTTITGSGTSNLAIAATAAAGALSFAGNAISGFDAINVAVAMGNNNVDLTLDAASLANEVMTLTGDVANNIALTQTDNLSLVTRTGFNLVTVTDTQRLTVSDRFVNATATTYTGSANAAAEIVFEMRGTTLNLGGDTFGSGGTDIQTTITGTAGNDTITFADSKLAGSAMSVTGNGGDDAFRFEDNSGNAFDTAGAGLFTAVLTDAVRIRDFSGTGDQIVGAAADISSANKVSGAVAAGAWNLDTVGFALITGAALNDFTSEAGVYAAVGNVTASDTEVAYFALSNVAGTQIGVYVVDITGAKTAQALDGDDNVSLVAVIDVTSGTFGAGNLSLF